MVIRIIVLLVLAISPTLSGQSLSVEKSRSPILLLPSYLIQWTPGWEGGASGKFYKPKGLSVQFNFGGQYAGSHAESVPPSEIAWRVLQERNGNKFTFVCTKDNRLVATALVGKSFPANFEAQIHDQQELAEMILMVLTYEPLHGYPVDASAIVSSPQQKN